MAPSDAEDSKIRSLQSFYINDPTISANGNERTMNCHFGTAF